MKLRHFLDAAYVVLVEEWQKAGLDVLSAAEKMHEWAAGDGSPGVDTPPPTADSLAQLNAMMAGFK